MRKQINAALVLAIFFVFWLFYSTSQAKSTWVVQGDFSGNNIPIIYNKNTGESWKYYITGSGDDVDFGWTPMIYKFTEQAVGITPEIALANFREKSQENNTVVKK